MNGERFEITEHQGARELLLAGDWTIHQELETSDQIIQAYQQMAFHKVTGAAVEQWDSALISLLLRLKQLASQQGATLELGAFPEGVMQLVALAGKVPERQGTNKQKAKSSLLSNIGDKAITDYREALNFFFFLGESVKSVLRLFRGKARFRGRDLREILSDTGPEALPIVTLISVLVGIILAFVGAVQLRQFGAEIYVADLVSIAMVREMGCMMTGIIMAGRTGAAFAARIGTMQVNEEIDAFKTLGISPMDFLVLPRILALVIMMPLLSLYADVLGILGGAAISIGAMGLSFTEYWNQTLNAVDMIDISLGLIKAFIFGIVIAITGCMNGIMSGRSASAVGDAATSAVVAGVVFIIVIDGLFAIVTSLLGI
ncbi:ABC transporter permease [Kangiella shandongensis]|uniref:ABC transporter permease n=1 Tax=Kangiella shandongensis TaxID=2763258 RepID=UPI001CBDB016|nr:MlaE family lipid ABC transporter permease subunit [Kangiella shandongensis]